MFLYEMLIFLSSTQFSKERVDKKIVYLVIEKGKNFEIDECAYRLRGE